MSALGGAAAAADMAAIRAARLARLAGPAQTSRPVVAAANVPENAAPEMETGHTSTSSSSVSAAPAVGFASLPEAAFLQIISQVDIPSGIELTSAGGVARQSTEAGLGFLKQQMERARQAHRTETAAIEAERERTRARHAREQAVMNEALGHLAALRASAAVGTRPEFQNILQALEAGPEGVQEAEQDFAARAARADYALHVSEMTARTRVAEGELRAISSH